MNYLFEYPEYLLVYLSYIRIQKVLHEADITYPLPRIRNMSEICDYASDILHESLPVANDTLQVFDYYASCSILDVILDYTSIPFKFGYEEEFANLRESHSQEDLEDSEMSEILCFSSSYLTLEDYEHIGKLYDIGGFPSTCGKAYIYEYVDNGYSRYGFESWVMKYLEIMTRLAALVTERKRENA